MNAVADVVCLSCVVSFSLEASPSKPKTVDDKSADPAKEIAAFLQSEHVGLTAEEAKKSAEAAGTYVTGHVLD